MLLLWSVSDDDGGRLLRVGTGRTDDGNAIVGRIQPRPLAVGFGREASWGPLWLMIRHSMKCWVQVTPILDGRVLTELAVTHELSAPDGGGAVDVPMKVYLSRPDDPDVPWSRQALRGVWFAPRVEIEALEDGEVLAVGGFEIDVRPLGWARGAINAGG